MKQVFYRYEFWEDYQNGMYRNSNDSGREDRIRRAAELFRDEAKCREEMRTVAFAWKTLILATPRLIAFLIISVGIPVPP